MYGCPLNTLLNIRQLKTIGPWLAEARYAWLSLSVIGVALAISLRPHTTEPVIRFTGLVLQLLGIGTVIWGIAETRTLFGHPSFVGKTKAWLSRFPMLRRNGMLAVDSMTSTCTIGNVKLFQTHVAGANPTIKDRLDVLEKNVISIHERINQTQKEMDEEFQKTANALKREAQSRQAEDCAIRMKLEATGTGGVHISAVGALWLFAGVILSTAAIEIAGILK